MSTFDNIEELADDLYSYGPQKLYGVICKAEGFNPQWGWMFDSLDDAEREAVLLSARHGVPFKAVTMRLIPEIIKRD